MGRVTVKHFIQQLSSVSLLGNNVFEIPCKHLTKGLVSIFGSFGIILRAKYGNHKPNPVCSRASQEILLSLTLIIMGWYFFYITIYFTVLLSCSSHVGYLLCEWVLYFSEVLNCYVAVLGVLLYVLSNISLILINYQVLYLFTCMTGSLLMRLHFFFFL